MPSLEDFLEQQLEGEVQVQDANFSLSPEHAREKLRTFQEALPCYSLLRLIQGLQLAGSDRIELEVGEKEFELSATGSFQADLLDQVKAAYQGTALFDNTAYSICALACHAVQLYDLESLAMRHQGGDWSIVGNASNNRGEPTSFQLTAGLKKSGTDSFLTGIPELKKRCRFANAEIIVVGEKLRPTITPTLKNKRSQSSGHLEFYTEWVQAGPGFRYDLVTLQNFDEQDGVKILKRYETHEDTERPPFFYGGLAPGFQESYVTVEKAVGLTLSGLQGESKNGIWIFLRHGVVAEAVEGSDLFPNSVALIDVSELPADLSGLRSVDTEKLSLKKAEALELMVKACSQSSTLLSKHWKETYDLIALKAALEVAPSGCLIKLLLPLFRKNLNRTLSNFQDRMEPAVENEVKELKKWCEERKKENT